VFGGGENWSMKRTRFRGASELVALFTRQIAEGSRHQGSACLRGCGGRCVSSSRRPLGGGEGQKVKKKRVSGSPRANSRLQHTRGEELLQGLNGALCIFGVVGGASVGYGLKGDRGGGIAEKGVACSPGSRVGGRSSDASQRLEAFQTILAPNTGRQTGVCPLNTKKQEGKGDAILNDPKNRGGGNSSRGISE